MRQWNCTECCKTFASNTALAAHRARAHNIKNAARRYVYGSQCPSCLVEFHNRYRLMVHLVYRSLVCHAIAKIEIEPMETDAADLLDEKDRPELRALSRVGRGSAFAKVACCQAQGPLFASAYKHDAYDPAGPSIGFYPPLRRKCDRKVNITRWPSTSSCPATSTLRQCTDVCIICTGIDTQPLVVGGPCQIENG